MFVPGRFDGCRPTLVLDTGAERVVLTEAAVTRRHFKRDLRPAATSWGSDFLHRRRIWLSAASRRLLFPESLG